MEKRSGAEKLRRLLNAQPFSAEVLRAELQSGQYSPEDVNTAAFLYVESDCYLELELDWEDPQWRQPGELVEGCSSSHLLEALEILLDFGLDPNWMYDGNRNIIYNLQFVINGYVAADALNLLLSHGGDAQLNVDDYPLNETITLDVLFDNLEQENRLWYDAYMHYGMVLVSYGNHYDDGTEIVKMRPGHDVSELRNHRACYYGEIYVEEDPYHRFMCLFDKQTNLEIGRY